MIFESKNKWILSANGTIFTYEFEAIIPGLLKRWYAERQEMQRKMGDCGDNEIEKAYWDKRQLVKKINSLMEQVNEYEQLFDCTLTDINDQDTLNLIHSVFDP